MYKIVETAKEADVNIGFYGKTDDSLLQGQQRIVAHEYVRELLRTTPQLKHLADFHTAFVSSFRFRDGGIFDDDYKRWSRNVDWTNKYPDLYQFVSQAERQRLLEGDCLIAYNGDGKFRIIPGRFIQNPNSPTNGWFNGVSCVDGAVVGFNVRSSDGVDKFLFSADTFHLKYCTDYEERRGVSPLLVCAHYFANISSGIRHALNRSRLAQMLGVAVYRKGAEQSDTIEFKDGLAIMDLDQQDRAEFLHAGLPEGEFQEFIKVVTQASYSALSVPYGYYDGAVDLNSLTPFMSAVRTRQRDIIRLVDWMFDTMLREKYSDRPDLQDEIGKVPFAAGSYPVEFVLNHVAEIASATQLGILDSEMYDMLGVKKPTISNSYINLGVTNAEKRG